MKHLPSGAVIKENESLAKYTSYRIGGAAKYFVFPKNEEDLKAIGEELLRTREHYFVLGNGSNVLVPDEGFDGWIISTRELYSDAIAFLDNTKVKVGAGVLNARLLRAAAEEGLHGIEFLSGVPGNVGGAVFMNAGTGSGWIADRVLEVTSFSLKEGKKIHPKSDLKYSYREQHFLGRDEIIVSAELELVRADPATIKADLAESIRKRKAAQPIELPSCGSVFRNPPGHNAWKLIETAGLRGYQCGGARISEKHANFIVNEGGATAEDVRTLIKLAKEKVRATTGVELAQEVIFLEGKILL